MVTQKPKRGPGAPLGHPRYGGRVAGTPNRATVAKAEAIALAHDAMGMTAADIAKLTPLDGMMLVMRWGVETKNPGVVLAAAAAAAPYVHARLSQSEVRISGTVTLSDEQLQQEIAALEARMRQVEAVH
jgi:hypothetical protein